MEKEEKRREMDFLLPLRGIFAIVIVMHHYIPRINYSYGGLLGLIGSMGFLAVEFYFVVSGITFVFAYYEKINQGIYTLGDFMKRRLQKLYPMYALSLCVILILYQIRNLYGETYPVSFINVIYNIFMLQEAIVPKCEINPVTWYLTPLIVCSVLAFLISRIKKKDYTILLSVLILLSGIVIMYNRMTYCVLNSCMARGLLGFFTGVIIAFFLDTLKSLARKKWIGCFVWFNILWYAYSLVHRTMENWQIIIITDLWILPMLFLLFYRYKWLCKIVSNPCFDFLGKISYYLYLWHFPVIVLFEVIIVSFGLDDFFPNQIRVFVPYVIVLLGLCSICYRMETRKQKTKLIEKDM